MIYCSIDIETTGLDFKQNDIIEFAAIIDDTMKFDVPLENLPKFHCYFIKDNYNGHPYALSMHKDIFEKLANSSKYKNDLFINIENLPSYFEKFLVKNSCFNKVNIAGKNAATFDIPFLKEKIKDWNGISFNHRVFDIASYFFKKDDECLPSLEECLKRANINKPVSHTALDDAYLVVQLIRKTLNNDNLNKI